jgi:uncharacterized protein YndB with AHSA1/START domain
MNAPDADAESLEYEVDLDEPLEKVWRALTVPEIVAAWILPEENELESEAVECDLVIAEPPHRVSYRWQRDGEPATYITFELMRIHGGTRLRLTHASTLQISGPVAMRMAA